MSEGQVRFRCCDCPYKTDYLSGAQSHSIEAKHFITDAPMTDDDGINSRVALI